MIKHALLPWTLCFASCSPYPDLSKFAETSEHPMASVEETPGLHAEIRGLEKADEYGAAITWSFDESQALKGLQLFRIADHEKKLLTQNLAASGIWWDTPLASDTEYHYEISALSGSIVAAIDLRTARDLVVHGEMRLPQDYAKISRLFFESNAVLVTDGLPIDWSLAELHGAPGARFVSFLKESPAHAGYVARSSGKGRLTVAVASSSLRLEWRGETGAKGAVGATNGGRGAPGSDGSSGHHFGGGHHGDGDGCTSGGNGGQGGQGPSGFAGGDGDRGGNAQSLEIKILSAAPDLDLQTKVEAGEGGPGGLGGEGGKGGPGGRAGTGGFDCGDGSPGREGPPGPRGSQGKPGVSGDVDGTACLLKGDKKTCYASITKV